MDGRGTYSTLEVADQQNIPSGQPGKEVVYRPDENLPQAVNPTPDYYKQDGTVNGVHAVNGVNGVNGANGQPPVYNQYYPYQQPQQPPPPEAPPKKRICGLSVRAVIIIAVLAVLLFVGLGVGLGVGLSNSNKDTASPPTVTSAPSTPGGSSNGTTTVDPLAAVLPSSKLAVGNWTDATQKFRHHGVIYQTQFSLMGSFWDSANQTWTSVNISKALAKANTPITVKPGTPLTMAVTGSPWPFQMSIYYLTPQNLIGEVFIKNELTYADWSIGDVLKKGQHKTHEKSQLTSLWHRCDFGCSGQLFIVYQDEQNNMQFINSSDITKPQQIATGLDPGAALALIPVLGEGGKNGYQPYELRLYYQKNGLQELDFRAQLIWATAPPLNSQALSLTPNPQFAATVFDSWTQQMVLQLDPSGVLTAYRYDNTGQWNYNQKITLSGGPASPNFTSIAFNEDRGFYGVVDGTIQEFSMTFEDPYTFVSIGAVLTPKATADGS